MNKEVKKLLNLQEIDKSISEKERLLNNIKERKEKLAGEIEDIKKREDERDRQLRKLKQTSEKKNERVDNLQEQIEKYQRRLDEGIISFKETEALEAKIENSRKKMEDLEDEAIEIMMKIDKTEEERESQKSEAQADIAKKRKMIEELNTKRDRLSDELDELQKERNDAVEEIPNRLTDQYERLRSNSTEAVVQVKGRVCQGCHMSVSKNTVKQARNNQGIATCENCSRILYLR